MWWKGIQHIFRMDVENDCRTALGWTPKGIEVVQEEGRDGKQKVRESNQVGHRGAYSE